MESHNQRLEVLFDAALDLPPDEQAAFLDQACVDDDDLRRSLEAMLAIARMDAPPVLASGSDAGPDTPDTMLTPIMLKRRKRPQKRTEPSLLLEPGIRIQQYEIIRELGRGGMGAVYLARDIKLGRRVAVKFMQSERRALTKRFLQEARATARCSHENIVVIHEVDEHQNQPFMVLEYLKGRPLSKLIENKPVPPSRAVQLMVPVARALVCAHEHHIVHRDLKPENIFVTESGNIKVLDFGIAKFVFETKRKNLPKSPATTIEMDGTPEPSLTQANMLIGTLPYMSPEQWSQEPIDHRADIWAVGIMLYTMVTGRHPLAPLRGEQLMVTAVLDQPMPSARDARVDMPSALANLIDKCLKKYKEERIPDARQLLTALEALLPERTATELQGDASPYTGLTSFQETDATRFFGRGRDIATMLTWLQDKPLIAVVGPSGVGKSSFVRAGVIPALRQAGEGWETFVIRPGREPLAALADIATRVLTAENASLPDELSLRQDILTRLASEPGYLAAMLRGRARKRAQKILLFVDQFEELYTLTPDLDQRKAFTACLAAISDDAASPLRIVLSIRSDFLDRAAEDRHFMSELNQGLYFLPQLDRASLRDALTRPAEMAGYHFESTWMMDHMLDALDATTGALPLLQFTATILWDRRDLTKQLLSEASYRDIGGIEGALASHADAVLANLRVDDQNLVRSIFLKLVTPERTRAIASIEELREITQYSDSIQRLVDYLVNARLLVVQSGDTAAGSFVEIVHESLLRTWPTLERWLDENHDDAMFLDQIKSVAKQWEAKGRPIGLLWRGETASEARRWRHRYRGSLPPVYEQYLDAVTQLATRAVRMKRFMVMGTIMLLSLLVVAGSVALVWIGNTKQDAIAAAQQARDSEQKAIKNADHAEEAQKRAQIAKKEADDRLAEILKANNKAKLAQLGQQEAEALAEKVRGQVSGLKQTLLREIEGNDLLKQELIKIEQVMKDAWATVAVQVRERDEAAAAAERMRQELVPLRHTKARLDAEVAKRKKDIEVIQALKAEKAATEKAYHALKRIYEDIKDK